MLYKKGTQEVTAMSAYKKVKIQKEKPIAQELFGMENFIKNFNIKKHGHLIPYAIELNNSTLSGFGNVILQLKKKVSNRCVCYINSEGYMYLPQPLSIDEIHRVSSFIESFGFLKVDETKGKAI